MPVNNSETCHIRFATENLLRTGVVSINTSSEFPATPKSFLIDNQRARAFRFAGRFTITTQNNKLYFNDGTDKIAVISVGEYTTPDSLAAEIQTKLNSVSSGFTVTYDPDLYVFKISRTAPTFIMQFSNTTEAIWETIGFSINQNDQGSDFEADEQRAHWPNETITIDFGYQASIGFLGIIGGINEGFEISPDAKINIKANTVNDFSGSELLSLDLQISKQGIFYYFDTPNVDYRYWQITIEDRYNSNGPTGVAIGNLFLGQYLTFESRNISRGFEVYDQDNSITSEAQNGQLFTNERENNRIFNSMIIEFLNIANREVLTDIYKRFKKFNPFYVSIDPSGEFSSGIHEFTAFVTFSDDPKYQHIVSEFFRTNINLSEVI